LAALAAATAWHLDVRVFLVVLVAAGALIVVSYRRVSKTDVGLTGEFALLATTLLGALAVEQPGLAAALGVATAGLLHLRSELHHLGREIISEQEVHDGLVLAASAAIVLPLLPTTPVDPWGVIVPASLWKLVVLVMAAGVAGEIALRVVGARFGLPLAGFCAGFASSTAATATYGTRAKADPESMAYAASAAIFANLATVLLLIAVLASASPSLVQTLAWPLAAACITLVLAGASGLIGGGGSAPETTAERPQAFKLTHALALMAFVGTLLIVSSVLTDWLGERGALMATVVAGTVELQGSALAIAQLARAGRLTPEDARWGIVLLLASSSTVKSVLAFVSGGRTYGLRVAAALGVTVVAAALAAWTLP
jgi:uncharacterized membrane protein (DUF4010 family)